MLRRLDEVLFTLRGYPESHKETLLLIVVSRYIERRAWLTGEETHRASFQRLSRMKDERGTRAVYETLGDSGVQTHVYGIPDRLPPMEAGLTVHGGYSAPFQDSWFVVFTPPEDGERSQAALVAIGTEPRRWQAFWTFCRSLVADINDHIAHNL